MQLVNIFEYSAHCRYLELISGDINIVEPLAPSRAFQVDLELQILGPIDQCLNMDMELLTLSANGRKRGHHPMYVEVLLRIQQ